MENNASGSGRTDEIDLTQFFRWIGRGLNRVGSGILYVLSFLRNLFFSNLKFFAFLVLAGLTLGVIYSELLKKEYYKTSMVLSCSYFNNQIVDNTIDKLNTLCAEKERKGLARELNIADTLAKNVLGFEYEPFVSENDVVEMEVLKEQLNNAAANKKELVDKIISRINIENKDAYRISVTVSNPQIVKALETSLVNYFRENNYVARRLEISKILRQQRRDKLARESKKIDSLKAAIYSNLESIAKSSKGSNNVILNDDRVNDPIALFKEDLLMNQEMLALQQDIFLQPDFELIDGFTGFNKPENASFLKILVIAFIISFVSGYLILLGIRFDRMLASYQMKNSD